MRLSMIDLVIIVGFLLGMLAIGVHFSPKRNEPEEFMVAKRSLPGWLLGFSIFATQVSNITLLGTAGKAFGENWAPLAMQLALPIAIIISCKYFIPFHRMNQSISSLTHLEKRFGSWATIYAAASYIFIQLLRMSVMMYLMGLSLGSVFGFNYVAIILITGLIVISYSYLGGLEAIIWADFFQGIILILGIAVAIIYVLFHMPEGPSQIVAIASEHDKFSLGSFSFAFSKPTFWVMLFLGLTIYLQDFGINQNYVAAKSQADAQKALWITLGLMIPLMILVSFLGTSLFSFYTAQPELSITEGIFAMAFDNVFPHFIATQLPLGIKGFLLAAILASAMSSIDSSLNSITTIFFTNIYLRYQNRDPGKKKSMRILHQVSFTCGLLSIAIAMLMFRIKSIWDVWFTVSTILGGAVFGVFVLGFISKKVNNAAAITGTIVGALSLIWMLFSEKMYFLPSFLTSPFHSLMIGVVGTIVIIATGLLYAQLFVKKLDYQVEEAISETPSS